MALTTDRKDITPKDTWVLYEPTDVCRIKNITTTPIEYAFEADSPISVTLMPEEYIPSDINQPVYFKASKIGATIGITLGIATDNSSASILGSVALANEYGDTATITAFGDLRVAVPKKQITLKFNKPLSTDKITTVGTPTSMFNGTILRLQDGDSVQTKDVVVYEAGDAVEVDFTAEWSELGASGDQALIGLYDIYDGIYLGRKDGDFIVGYRNIHAESGEGVTTTAPDVVAVILEGDIALDKLYRFKIQYGYLGVANILVTYKPFGQKTPYKKLHMFETDGALSQRTHIGNPTLPMRTEVSGATAGELFSGSWSAITYSASESSIQSDPFEIGIERVVSVDDGEQLPIAAYRSKTVYNGFPNKTRSLLLSMLAATNSEGWYVIETYLNPIGVVSGGTWQEAGESVIEYNDGVSFAPDISDKPVLSIQLQVESAGKGIGESSRALKDRHIRSNPGDVFVVTKRCITQGGGDDDTILTIEYKDEF